MRISLTRSAAIAAGMLIILSSLILTGCGNKTAAKITCATSFANWYYHQGGKTEVATLSQNFRPMAATAESGRHQGRMLREVSHVVAADNSLQHHMPPACVPNLDTNLRAALVAINNVARAAVVSNVKQVRADTKIASQNLVLSVKDLNTYARSK